MSTLGTSFLRRVLIADGAISGCHRIADGLRRGALQERLGVPAPLLRYAGLSLVPFAGLIAYLLTREALSRAGVVAVIALNAAWVAGSVLLLALGGIAPNALGYAFILGQALAVAVIAELEYVGLRQAFAVVA